MHHNVKKIKTISRSEEEYTRERPTDIIKIFKNVDPLQHPFEKPKEYIRALNAGISFFLNIIIKIIYSENMNLSSNLIVKLQKVFAKPFVGALQGHRDGVYSLAKHPKSLSALLSGSCDGGSIYFIFFFSIEQKLDSGIFLLGNEKYFPYLFLRTTVWHVKAHSGYVRGLSVCYNTDAFLSCGDDKVSLHFIFAHSSI